MQRANSRLSTCVVLICALVGCHGVENADEAPTAPAGAGASLAKRGHATPDHGGRDRPRTSDGYNIVFADPPGKQGPRASRPGEATEQRAREQLIRQPTSPDPEAGSFTLQESVVGLGTDGTLVAEIGTELGTLFCDLYADKTPNTVANFIGLARGIRPWWDARSGTWQTRPYYRDTTFHRVIPGYMIQGGDNLGDGSGEVGYLIPDERHASLDHNSAGLLCMANRGPNTNSAQFFITDGPAPQLDATQPGQPPNAYTVFGRCIPPEVVQHIARVPQAPPENRPINPVTITRVIIRRVRGGAANTRVTVPTLPPEQSGQPTRPRGASPDPSRR
ncbi:MAG: peptidylprolyl isomerase [Sandaracinaceae bacterium]|nr:peptidylprolyl isomerase [Sandaracinaceae bacterium]